jgi:hypothetical protein
MANNRFHRLNKLVFWFGPTNVTSMDKPFFRRLFSRPQKPAVETTETMQLSPIGAGVG